MQCNTDDKDRLRHEMKNLRRSLSCEHIKDMSQRICQNLFELDIFKNAKTVCVYMSAFNEVDTASVIEKCLSENKTVIVPVVDGDDIYTAEYSPATSKGAFGIREPQIKKPTDINCADLVIVPGLAFSKSGGRVGFGKGYYDKLLKNTKAEKAGFLYDFQLVETVKTESHDILMNYLITESRVIDCGIQRN